MSTRLSRTAVLHKAKDVASELRAALKTGSDPAEPEIENLRRSLRDLYLSFLFAGKSLSARAVDVLNLMWLECSHALIKRHRDRIAHIDAELDRSSGLSRKQRAQSYKAGEGTGTRRKLVHGLRAFLTQEEGFWASLIGRLIETYHVGRARRAAVTLKLYAVPEVSAEEAAVPEVEHALALVQVALVFYGDLARYSELYRDAPNKDRRFERAAECYHQARLLLPSTGQPDHQLAVIASGRKDSLAAAFHYMRALAVRSSFATARPNLETTYKQAIAQYRSKKDGQESDMDAGQEAVQTLITLLALLVVDSSSRMPSTEEVNVLADKHKQLFASALETRLLSSENIIKILLLTISTWWDARLGSDAESARKRNESTLLSLVLDILITLFTVASNMTEASLEASLNAPRPGDPAAQLASRIAAPVRRIAPALRIASTWMLGNIEQIGRSASKDAFWAAYGQAVNIFITAFPPDLLPSLPSGCNLEEDFELLAFLPCPLPPGNAAEPYIADHPNSEFFFRIQGFVSDATLALGQSEGLKNVSDVFGDQSLNVDPRLNIPFEDDADLLTEAMDAARLSTSYPIEEQDEEDEIVYQPRQAGRIPSPLGQSTGSAAAGPTASDLLSSMLRGEVSLPAQQNIWAPSGQQHADPWASPVGGQAWQPSANPWGPVQQQPQPR